MNQNTGNQVTYGQSDDAQTQAMNNEIKSRDDEQRELLNLFVEGYAATSGKAAAEVEEQRQQQAETLERNIRSGAEMQPNAVLAYAYDKIRESRTAQERGEKYDENPTRIKAASSSSEVEALRSAVEALTVQMQTMVES